MDEEAIASYQYIDPDTGALLATKKRFEPKRFVWYTADGREGGIKLQDLPLYNAHLLTEHPLDKYVFVTEGEKAADALREKTGALVLALGGASVKPTLDQLKPLKGRRVVLWPDRDQPGRGLMRRVIKRLQPLAAELRCVYPSDVPIKGDAHDWLMARSPKQAVRDLKLELETNAMGVLAARILNVTSLDEVEAREIRWLWPGYFPVGMLTMVEGPKGVGKSFVTLKLASQLSMGDVNFPVAKGSFGKGKTLLLSHEDPVEEVLVPRLLKMGADRSQIKLISSVTDNETEEQQWFDLKRDLEIVEEELLRDDYALLVIDPINNYLDPNVINANSDTHMRSVLSPLADMAQRTGVCVIGIRHYRKSKEGPMLDWGTGSGAYGNVARMVHGVLFNPRVEGERLLFPVATNLIVKPNPVAFKIGAGKDGVAGLEWLGERDYPEELLRADMRKETVAKTEDFFRSGKVKLSALFEDGQPRSLDELKELLRTDKATAMSLCYDLGATIEGDIVTPPARTDF